MIIESIEIANFRVFGAFSLGLGGRSVFLVSENAAGKSSLLLAIAKALGKDRGVTLADFADSAAPIEIVVRLSGFDRVDQGVFPKELSFAGKTPSLAVGFRAEWNAVEEESNAVCGFPDHGWRPATREQRDALRLVWLPAYRDPARLLQLASKGGFWARLFSSMKIDTDIQAAIDAVNVALGAFAGTKDMAQILGELRNSLARLIPQVDAQAFTLGFQGGASERELLGEFEVLLSHSGPSLPVQKQSDGLMHLAVFAFALKVIANDRKAIFLVDEPEISLHPQAQRALSTACRNLPNQSIIATHSPGVLDRADMRGVVRLCGSKGAVSAARAGSLSDGEANRLARFLNPLTAEACFARKVILVEGYSDRM
jgi:predicted ATPase